MTFKTKTSETKYGTASIYPEDGQPYDCFSAITEVYSPRPDLQEMDGSASIKQVVVLGLSYCHCILEIISCKKVPIITIATVLA